MKKIFVMLVALVLASGVAMAQTKGEKYVGGTFGLSTASETSTAVAVAVEGGYFIADKWKLSGALEYQYVSDVHTMTIGPAISYYVQLTDKFFYNPSFSLGAAYAKVNLDDTLLGDVSASSWGFFAGINLLSVEFRPVDRFAIGVGLAGLNYVTFDNDDSIGFNLLMGNTVSFRYYF